MNKIQIIFQELHIILKLMNDIKVFLNKNINLSIISIILFFLHNM